jgi:uncharacterized membrane protein (UPF0127 family)
MTSWHRWAAAAAVLALALAVACGDDGGGGGSDAPSGPLSLDELAALAGDAPAVAVSPPEIRPGAPGGDPPVDGVGETAVSITAPDGSTVACCVMVAASPQQRQRGLMEVTDFGGYEGMLFVWPSDNEGGFWMRNTPTPLSIAWFDADGEFVSAADMAPCGDSDDCPTYSPAGGYRFALEVEQGGLEAIGAVPGSRLTVGGDCG